MQTASAVKKIHPIKDEETKKARVVIDRGPFYFDSGVFLRPQRSLIA